MINLDDYTVNESNVIDEQIVISDSNCETINKGCDCFDYYRCCDCGGNNCGCLGCFSCNACDVCKGE